ncbi:hypothetical protein ACN2XU_20645 [Primorskyibacter sp. 2E107]|uniref:hypothetical protein n=1 Tax=Primorskyibacter sp. 2E107 TaxID=3403458 RepID=UPI003AF9761D
MHDVIWGQTMAKDSERSADIRQRATEVLELLESAYLPLSRLMRDADDAGSDPVNDKYVAEVTKSLQDLCDKAGLNTRPMLTEIAHTAAPQTSAPSSRKDKPAGPAARAAKLSNFLLLLAIRQKNDLGEAVSQTYLFDLLCRFDPVQLNKRPSYTARLGRFRNDKSWINWSDTDDLTITADGRDEEIRLYKIVKAHKDFADLEECLTREFGSKLYFVMAKT